MDVRCDKCGTEYEFDENRIGANGVTVKCTACGFVFKVRRPRRPPPRATTTIGKGPQGKEWLVRKPDGQMIAFRELTTLQKWIVEGRISRDDEISKNGETWKRLGNIMELEPFFSVYEKARTLNTLMDGSEQVELRGSEVLGAANPIQQAPPQSVTQHPQPIQTTPPPPHSVPQPAAPIALSNPSPQPQTPPSAPTVPVPAASQPVPQPITGTMPPPAHVAAAHDTVPAPAASQPGMLPGNGSEAPAFQAPKPSATPPPATKTRPNNVQPAAAPAFEADLTFEIDEDRPRRGHSDIVNNFERGQRRKRFAWVFVALVLIGAAGGIALAIWGPEEGNPVKALALKYGLLPKPAPVEDGAGRMVEDAQSSADIDTIASLEKAADLLSQAQAIRKNDPIIAAERALVLVTEAASYTRWAKDLEAEAARAEEAKKKEEAAALRAKAEEKKKLAAPLLKQTFELASQSAGSAPNALEPARALAAYHLSSSDDAAYQKAIAKAKAGMEKAGRVDPATLYLEASAAVKDPSDASPEGLDRAKSLLEQALTTRPTMNRARVLLARVHLAQSAPGPAKVELDKVLATAPSHQEAQRLVARAKASEKALAAKKGEKKKKKEEKEKKKADPEEEGPKPYEWWMAKADSLRERDRTAAAMNAYGRAAEIRPGSAEPHTGKGWCFLDMDRPHLALAAFERAVKANDHYVEAYYGLAESYRALGKTAEAIKAFEQYLARAPAGSRDRRVAEQTLKRLKAQ